MDRRIDCVHWSKDSISLSVSFPQVGLWVQNSLSQNLILAFLKEKNKQILQCIWEKQPRVTKTTWKKKSELEGITAVDFKTYSVMVISQVLGGP